MENSIFRIVDKDALIKLLTSFYECFKLPVEVLDSSGKMLIRMGNVEQYCKTLFEFIPYSDSCAQQHARAGRHAELFGDVYTFSCHMNRNHIIFPLMHENTFIGSVLAGPFLMESPDSWFVYEVTKKYDGIPPQKLLEFYEDSMNLPVIPPHMVTNMSRILYYLFSGLSSDSRQQLLINRQQIHQQSKINESIQMYKNTFSAEGSEYPMDLERKLLQEVKTCNAKGASEVINKLLGYITFTEGGDLKVISARALELLFLMSRAAIEGGARQKNILKYNLYYCNLIQSASLQETIFGILGEALSTFTESELVQHGTKNSRLVRKAMEYVAENFTSSVTLEQTAEYMHLNPTYLSGLFKQTCGMSFSNYLNTLRIEESRRLLENTDYSVINIAIASGFSDQSYFSKVFKRMVGISPSSYRSR